MNKYKGFSLVEMLVTMAIFAILSVMLLNSLLLNVRLSTKVNVRSRVRSDLNELATQIERDIRNAQEIDRNNCGVAPDYNYCNMVVNGQNVRWMINLTDHQVIRRTSGVPTFYSSPNLYFTNTGLRFSKSTIDSDDSNRYRYANIVVTLFAESSDRLGCDDPGSNRICRNSEPGDILWVENQVRQFSVSTRNYLID